jgi:hypothetical protein
VNAVRGVQRASLLHAPQASQQLRGSDLADRARAQPGEEIHLQAVEDLARVAVGPIDRELAKALARDRLEGVRLGGPLRLPPDPRIAPRRQIPAEPRRGDAGPL